MLLYLGSLSLIHEAGKQFCGILILGDILGFCFNVQLKFLHIRN